MAWRPIAKAPKDGRLVRLKRVFEGLVVADGRGFFGTVVIRYSEGDIQAFRETWVDEDKAHLFPEPTHWMPLRGVAERRPHGRRREVSEINTPREVVEAWDRGETIWSIEMGGLGPGYEQAIQVLIIELLRDHGERPLPEPETAKAQTWGDDTVSRVNKWPGCGFSGAQVGAARQVAYRIIRDGHKATLDSMRSGDSDRLIQVSKTWPRQPAEDGQ